MAPYDQRARPYCLMIRVMDFSSLLQTPLWQACRKFYFNRLSKLSLSMCRWADFQFFSSSLLSILSQGDSRNLKQLLNCHQTLRGFNLREAKYDVSILCVYVCVCFEGSTFEIFKVLVPFSFNLRIVFIVNRKDVKFQVKKSIKLRRYSIICIYTVECKSWVNNKNFWEEYFLLLNKV